MYYKNSNSLRMFPTKSVRPCFAYLTAQLNSR